ncbi:MAG: glycosyltransferase family A protein [Verrucomicrobiae bacterium]
MNGDLLSVVIPTYGREEVLISTLERVISLVPREILVIDQTPNHAELTALRLGEWARSGTILWCRLPAPSIPHAMNQGLLQACGDIVLFLDDDVDPSDSLLAAHEAAHRDRPDAWAVVGQVLQPGESPRRLAAGEEFLFCSDSPRAIRRAMAGNMSVKRSRAISAGGFDENFLGAAYMFETEFAERVIRRGGGIFFEPSASIRHLRAPRGGTRAHGSHLCTLSPAHSSGAYYYMALNSGIFGAAAPALRRLLSSVATRHHLRRPWGIPVTLIAELRGLAQALWLFLRGQRLLEANSEETAARQ